MLAVSEGLRMPLPWTPHVSHFSSPDFIRAVALAVIVVGMWMTRTVAGVVAWPPSAITPPWHTLHLRIQQVSRQSWAAPVG